jgi:hypothetical protein
MDPDTQALLTVTRAQLKSARRQLSTLVRLLADLDDRVGAEQQRTPEEGHRDEYDEDEDE